MKTTVIMLGMSLLNPWLYFREMVKQISKKPANNRKIHAVDMLSTYTQMAIIIPADDDAVLTLSA